MTTRNKIILGIFSAAAVGAIIGLLVAPEKGNEIRKQLKKTTGKWVDSMGRILSHSMDGVTRSSRTVQSPEV
jgi:gas vesicle protein